MGSKAVLAATMFVALFLSVPAYGEISPAAGSWQTYEVPTAGVAIDLPSSWTSTGYAHSTPQPGSTVASRIPGAAEIAQLTLKNKLVKFFAYAQTGEPVDMLVVRLSGSQLHNHGLVGELSAAARQLGIGGSGIHVAQATFPAGKATTLTIKTKLLGTELQESEYIFSRAGGMVELTFSAPAGLFAAYEPTFERTVRSLRYLEPS